MAVMNSSILYVISALSFLLLAMRRSKLAGDSSLMTYRGHSVLYTLIRCYFSPMHTTGQVGDCRSMIWYMIWYMSLSLSNNFKVF